MSVNERECARPSTKPDTFDFLNFVYLRIVYITSMDIVYTLPMYNRVNGSARRGCDFLKISDIHSLYRYNLSVASV